jgi:hypothetical protein
MRSINHPRSQPHVLRSARSRAPASRTAVARARCDGAAAAAGSRRPAAACQAAAQAAAPAWLLRPTPARPSPCRCERASHASAQGCARWAPLLTDTVGHMGAITGRFGGRAPSRGVGPAVHPPLPRQDACRASWSGWWWHRTWLTEPGPRQGALAARPCRLAGWPAPRRLAGCRAHRSPQARVTGACRPPAAPAAWPGPARVAARPRPGPREPARPPRRGRLPPGPRCPRPRGRSRQLPRAGRARVQPLPRPRPHNSITPAPSTMQ